MFCWEKNSLEKNVVCYLIRSCVWVERLSLRTCHAYVNTKLRQLIYVKRLVSGGLGLVLREAALSEPRICAEQMVWSRTRPLFAQKHLAASFPHTRRRLSSRFFSGVFIRAIQSKWFWLVYAKGELSSLAVHKGILLRKSEKEKKRRRRRVFVGSQLAEWVVVVLGQEAHALINAHNPYSHLCHSHSVALMLLIHLLHI